MKAIDPARLRSGLNSLSPHLVCANAADAIEFYKKAFDAKEVMRFAAPNGMLMHACLKINGASVLLVDEMPGYGVLGPKSRGGTSVTIHLVVADADEAASQAVAAGANVIMPVADQFWGDRYGIVEDPFGHRWSIATPNRALTADELAEAARAAMGSACEPT